MRAKCKLELNQKILEKENKLNPEDLFLIDRYGQYVTKRFKQSCCLNCDIEFRQLAESNFIFCSGKCATEYNKRIRGLL